MRDVIGPALAAAAPGGPLNDAAVVEVAGHAARLHDRLVRRQPDPLPRRRHRRAGRERHGQRPGDDGRPAARDLARLRHRGGAAARGARARSPRRRPGAAARAGARIVTGDTKVVGRGAADRLFVNTAGIGAGPGRRRPAADRARRRRRGHPVRPDRPPRRRDHERPRGPRVRGRDRLRHAAAQRPGGGDAGGRARTSTCCATRRAAASRRRSTRSPPTSGVGMVLDEPAIPIPGPVRAACEMLGLDPFHVANEGKLVAIVPAALGRRRPGRDAGPPRGRRGRRDRRGRRRPPGDGHHPHDRRLASGSSTCSSGSSCPGSAEAAPAAAARPRPSRPACRLGPRPCPVPVGPRTGHPAPYAQVRM